MSTEKKADFSGVSGSVDSTAEQVPKADFSGVSASVDSTADVVSGGTYTVQKGDSLSKIAKQHLGDANAGRRSSKPTAMCLMTRTRSSRARP